MDRADIVMVMPAEIAKREGVTPQAITKLVRQLVEKHDLPVERDGRGRIKRFSLAHFDHHRDQYGNSEKTRAARNDYEPLPGPQRPEEPLNLKSRDEALRREAWLKLTRQQLQMEEQLGNLLRLDKMEEAIGKCGSEIQKVIARLPNKSDDLAQAIAKEGESGVRRTLRQIAYDLNTEIAARLTDILVEAPKDDDMVVEAER